LDESYIKIVLQPLLKSIVRTGNILDFLSYTDIPIDSTPFVDAATRGVEMLKKFIDKKM